MLIPTSKETLQKADFTLNITLASCHGISTNCTTTQHYLIAEPLELNIANCNKLISK